MKPFAISWTHQNGIARVIQSQAIIEVPFTNTHKTIWAIWDTGATNSVIHTDVVTSLGLVPTGKTITYGVHGSATVNTYLVNIGLPNAPDANGVSETYFLPGIPVTESSALGDCSLLIGMDLISQGDFSVTNHMGITSFSFRVPSLHHIDYHGAHKNLALTGSLTEKFIKGTANPMASAVARPNTVGKTPPSPTIGRNDPCFCGSGKKYKKCHGANK